MIRCPSIRLLFIHLPKTGGSSVGVALNQWADRKLRKEPDSGPGWQLRQHCCYMHASYRKEQGMVRRLLEDGWTVTGTVRNPWTLMESLWHRFGTGTFETFCRNLDRVDLRACRSIFCHPTAPMSTFLGPASPVMHFETLAQDLRSVLLQCGVAEAELPEFGHYNEKPRTKEAVHTAASDAIIRERFAGDIERFGYDAPHAEPVRCEP